MGLNSVRRRRLFNAIRHTKGRHTKGSATTKRHMLGLFDLFPPTNSAQEPLSFPNLIQNSSCRTRKASGARLENFLFFDACDNIASIGSLRISQVLKVVIHSPT